MGALGRGFSSVSVSVSGLGFGGVWRIHAVPLINVRNQGENPSMKVYFEWIGWVRFVMFLFELHYSSREFLERSKPLEVGFV